MKKRLLTEFILLLGAGVLVFLDQLTKQLVLTNLTGGREIVVWDGVFKIVSHKNTGAVWGVMSGRTSLLSVFTVIILLGILVISYRIKWEYKRFRILKIVLMFVTAGAIGNLIDRIRLNYVVDFLYFELIDFPVFNVADCYITVSMFLLVILVLFYYKDEDFSLIWPKKSQSSATDSTTDSE